jgi:hypothetical protein
VFAHTSPIYVAVGGEWRPRDPATDDYMLTLIDGALGYLRNVSNRAAGDVTHHHGEPDHQAFLERPHREAIAAIEARRRQEQ